MNDGEAIMAAKASLAARLIQWRLPEAHAKANEFIDDMVRQGWKPHPRGLRRPPMASEECRTHPGEYSDFCRACISDKKAADQEAALPDGRWTPERIRADVRAACATKEPPHNPDTFATLAAPAVKADDERVAAATTTTKEQPHE